MSTDELMHIGTPRHSGRYPWGSGENPYQSAGSFLGAVDELRKKGLTDAEIAKAKEVAEVRGRNAAMNDKTTKADPVGDGLPDLAKGGETKQAPKRTDGENMVFGLVDNFKKKTEKFT